MQYTTKLTRPLRMRPLSLRTERSDQTNVLQNIPYPFYPRLRFSRLSNSPCFLPIPLRSVSPVVILPSRDSSVSCKLISGLEEWEPLLTGGVLPPSVSGPQFFV